MRRIAAVFLAITLLSYPVKCHSELSVSAKSAIMIDGETGRVIYEKNAEERLSMASTTKIITAITAIENGNLSDVVTVSENAASTEGSSVWLSPGEKLTLSELLYALMLESGNDASVAIAEHIGGSVAAFSEIMNDTCKKAGALNTNCVTSSGLDDENHYTTARDMAKIALYAMKSDIFRDIVSTYKATIPWEGSEWDRTLVNHNKLLNMYDGADGIKTGYTKKSGRCLVATAKKDDFRVITVTLNAPDDWNDHIAMFEYAFSNFKEVQKVLSKDISYGELKVIGSKNEKIAYGFNQEISVRKLSDELDFDIIYNLPYKLNAPISSGEKIGSADIIIDGAFYKTLDVLALENADKNDKTYILREVFIRLLKALLCLVR